MLMTTDTGTVERAMRGDREAFEAVYDASFPCVHAFAGRRCGGARIATEALTAAILARAFQDLDHYRGDVPWAAWLLGVAKQVLREQTLATRRRRLPERALPRTPVPHAS
jgi:DNA-directed RNA polymerase specialized sigma24 family protein